MIELLQDIAGLFRWLRACWFFEGTLSMNSGGHPLQKKQPWNSVADRATVQEAVQDGACRTLDQTRETKIYE